jgi:hypothetical protein
MACTDTLDEMRGSTWSPEIRSLRLASYRQECSGEWPLPATTSQSPSPMRIRWPSVRRW